VFHDATGVPTNDDHRKAASKKWKAVRVTYELERHENHMV